MKDKLLEIYHHRRQQYLNREDSDLKILQGLLKDLEGVINLSNVSEQEWMDMKPVGLEVINDLWYPDDSGEWFEWNEGKAPDLNAGTRVILLLECDRHAQEYNNCDYPLEVLDWDWTNYDDGKNIVAYKIVKD